MYIPIAWTLKQWHALLSLFLDPTGGLAWVLSIMLLVVTVRILLFPIFVKMIKSQRAMQELQPEIAKLRKEYGSDRQGMALAMQALQKERGVNPLAGCLPLLLQAPVFIALLHVLRRLGPDKPGLYTWSDQLTHNAAVAEVFGAPISSYFTMSGQPLQALIDETGTSSMNIKIVTAILTIIMAITQFITTKQIMKRSTTAGQLTDQMQMVQKLMLYGAPIGLLVSGTFFPLGVLLYWFFNNLWTIGQQFWVLKRMPPPGQTESTLDESVDRTKLAPRPGAKPAAKGKAAAVTAPKRTATTDTTEADPEPDTADDGAAAASTATKTRPKNGPKGKNAGKKNANAAGGAKPAKSGGAKKGAASTASTPARANSSGAAKKAVGSEGSGSSSASSPASTTPKPGARPGTVKRKKR
ncbi:membrane protein insertase YidC [Epidermidibacterium keratini]|uniref:Membrane protein insertase YidC n=1 Tax=Epidermidibacterium keratini TaxID=1891644 RepID=A0A7L4YSZ7_9ACTN|nr:membrane protein insertase YidC [Epidermidibacterium keratini]